MNDIDPNLLNKTSREIPEIGLQIFIRQRLDGA